MRQKGFEAVTNFDLSEYADVLAEHHAASRQQTHATVAGAGEGAGAGVSGSTAVTVPSPGAASVGGGQLAPSPPPASIQQRLTAASQSALGAMRPGPAAEQEPCAEAIETVKAFFSPNHKPKVWSFWNLSPFPSSGLPEVYAVI